jgi:hypothetical protein
MCTTPSTSKKEINILLTLERTCPLFSVWVNMVTSTDLTGAMTQGCSRNTDFHHLLQLL